MKKKINKSKNIFSIILMVLFGVIGICFSIAGAQPYSSGSYNNPNGIFLLIGFCGNIECIFLLLRKYDLSNAGWFAHKFLAIVGALIATLVGLLLGLISFTIYREIPNESKYIFWIVLIIIPIFFLLNKMISDWIRK